MRTVFTCLLILALSSFIICPVESNLSAQQLVDADTTISDELVGEKEKVEIIEQANLTDTIQRRPDLSFSNVQIGGEQSGLSLDQIGTGMVKSLEVLKASTPDIDADRRGGSLKIGLKPAYELQNPQTNLKVSAIYKGIFNSLGGSFDATTAFAVNKRLGLRLGLGMDGAELGSDRVRIRYGLDDSAGNAYYYASSIELMAAKTTRRNGSLSAGVDFKPADNIETYLHANWDLYRYQDYQYGVRLDFGNPSNFSLANKDAVLTGAGTVIRYDDSHDADISNLQVNTGIRYLGDQMELEFRAWLRKQSNDDPFASASRFRLTGQSIGYDALTTGFPSLKGIPESAGLFPIKSFEEGTKTEDNTNSAIALDLKIPVLLNGLRGYFKTGTKFLRNELDMQPVSRIHSPTGHLYLSEFTSGFNRADYMDDRYELGPVPDSRSIYRRFTQLQGDFTRDEIASVLKSSPSQFEASEDIQAAYLMLNTELGAWRFLGGVRFESTQLETIGNEVTLNGDDYVISELMSGNDFDNLFMNFHVGYRFSDQLSIIGSFTQTIRRPSYASTAPYRVVNLSQRRIEAGNPNLNPTLYDNLDLSFEYKLSNNQLLTIEAFYRTLENTQFNRQSIISGGPYDGFIAYIPDNGGSGTLSGFKTTWTHNLVEAQQEWLQPFAYSFTYSHSRSNSDYPLRPGEDLPLSQTPEHRALVILKYNLKPIFIQLEFNYRSTMVAYFSSQNAANDIHYLDSFFINLLIEYSLNSSTVLFVDWSNISMAFVNERYIGDSSRRYYYEYDPIRLLIGARITF